jgi:hypothetical protein
MTSSNARRTAAALLVLAPLSAAADDWQLGGHVKYQAALNNYDATSVFGAGGSVTAFDQEAGVRLKAEKRSGPWDFRLHYDLGLIHGDTLLASRAVSLPFGTYGLPTDSSRLFNLTGTLYDEGRAAAVQRIDRASVGYARGQYAFRIGRDAVSWGNGLVFQPMDIFNPFSPTAVDKEYKAGDDLVYGQLLFANGNDLQGILVPRRDASGTLAGGSSSLATKYRVRADGTDIDWLLARHYNESLAGAGVGIDWGGAVVRGDVLATATSGATILSGVANLAYSWTWANHNVSGYAEYFRNGFGQGDGDYSSAALAANTGLTARLSRGELFNLGRDYLTGGLTIELTPRWLLSPMVIWNMNDGSALAQFSASFDWKQNATLLLGGTLPLGPLGTEFGGIPLSTPGRYYRPALGAYARVARYF